MVKLGGNSQGLEGALGCVCFGSFTTICNDPNDTDTL